MGKGITGRKEPHPYMIGQQIAIGIAPPVGINVTIRVTQMISFLCPPNAFGCSLKMSFLFVTRCVPLYLSKASCALGSRISSWRPGALPPLWPCSSVSCGVRAELWQHAGFLPTRKVLLGGCWISTDRRTCAPSLNATKTGRKMGEKKKQAQADGREERALSGRIGGPSGGGSMQLVQLLSGTEPTITHSSLVDSLPSSPQLLAFVRLSRPRFYSADPPVCPRTRSELTLW